MKYVTDSRTWQWALGVLMALLPAAHATAAGAQTTGPASAGSKAVRIALVGDSTVTDNAGWGKGTTC